MESQFGIANVWIQGDFVTRAVAVLLLGMSLASWIVILIKALDIIKFKTNYDGQTIKMRATFAQLEMAGKSQVLMAALAPNNRALVATMNYDGLEPTWGLRELSLPNGRIAIVRRVDCTAVNGHIN